jgi:NADH-quinone oxidoreductase subunit D
VGDAGLSTGVIYGWIAREHLQDVFEEISGMRLLPHYIAVGGLREDLPEAPRPFKDTVRDLVEVLRKDLKLAEDLVNDSDFFVVRSRNVNPITTEEALELGITGPVLRSTGLPYDIRRVQPYCGYEEFDFEIPVGTYGDVYDRYVLRMEEMHQSLRIVEQALEALPETGEFKGEMPRSLRIPPGETYVRTESPKGELGIFLKSDGSANAYRVKVRTPGFSHAAALEALLEGAWIADSVMIGGSMDLVLGEVDR